MFTRQGVVLIRLTSPWTEWLILTQSFWYMKKEEKSADGFCSFCCPVQALAPLKTIIKWNLHIVSFLLKLWSCIKASKVIISAIADFTFSCDDWRVDLEGGAFWKAYDSWNGTNTFSQSKESGKHCTWWPLAVYSVVCGIFTSKSVQVCWCVKHGCVKHG